ncbi:MAG: PDZ domain-containing protein [Firmicutes bacterium]|nr:PDZ domain-containing protein [Bacillota bacterium]
MKQNSDKKTRIIIYTICILFLGVFLAYGIIYKFPAIFQETITKIEKDVTVTDEGIADAVEKVYDSVVVVSTYKDNTLYSSGSGFIYKIDGKKSYIITNNHVIADGDNYKVTYTDGEIIEASLLGGDEYADIAVLQVKSRENIKAVDIGATDALRVGDTTFTVGAPLDNVYSWTVTRGIISGKERLVEVSVDSMNDTDYIMNVLQTDAAVNSGNSGGPLCDSNGEVIGVISAKISSTGVEGMGFAIPIETAIEKAEQIINGESSEYPYMGISMLNVNDAYHYPQYYRYLNDNDINSGVMVVDVQDNSSAASAKLQTGDIIIGINGKKISNVAYLRYELYKFNVGDKIKVTFIRDGKEKTVSMKLTSKLQTS